MPTPTPKAESRLVRAIQKAQQAQAQQGEKGQEARAELNVLAAAAQVELAAQPVAVPAPVQAAAARPGMVERGKQLRAEARKLKQEARAAKDPAVRGQLQGRAELIDIEADKMAEEASLARDGILVVPAQAAPQVQAEETRLKLGGSGSGGQRATSAATQAAIADNQARAQARRAERAAGRAATTAVRGQVDEPATTEPPKPADVGPSGANGAGGPPGAVPEYLEPVESVVTPPVSSEQAPIQTTPPVTEHPPASKPPPGMDWTMPGESPAPPVPEAPTNRPAEPPGVLITSGATSSPVGLQKGSTLRTYGPWVLGGAAVVFLLWRARKNKR